MINTQWEETKSDLRNLMYEKHISPIEMAGKIGCDIRTLNEYLEGDAPIPMTRLENMASVLNVKLFEIMPVCKSTRHNDIFTPVLILQNQYKMKLKEAADDTQRLILRTKIAAIGEVLDAIHYDSYVEDITNQLLRNGLDDSE